MEIKKIIWKVVTNTAKKNPGLDSLYLQFEGDALFKYVKKIFNYFKPNLKEKMHKHNQKPNMKFTSITEKIIEEISKSKISVLCGRNNSGKSLILRELTTLLGETARYLGPSRYQNFNVLGQSSPKKDRKKSLFKQFIDQMKNSNQNVDQFHLNLGQDIAQMNNDQRKIFMAIMEELLHLKIGVEPTDPNNDMSPKYISVDGHNLSYTSSGYRLVATLVTSLLDKEHDTFLIDEPELGISPELQTILSDFIFNEKTRSKYFSHIKTIILATHSTLFLDRKEISNNYFIEKRDNYIDVSRASSPANINDMHFFLLGNRLESLYMPSVIVVVEGKTDHTFIERVLSTRYEGVTFSIIHANSDTRIRDLFHMTKSIFGDIQKSPYKDRIFAVIDSTHGDGLVNQLKKSGLPANNIIVWSKNGIEHYYPSEVMKVLFGSEGEINIDGDSISLNEQEYKKNDLAKLVINKITKDTIYNAEFESEFLDKIEKILV